MNVRSGNHFIMFIKEDFKMDFNKIKEAAQNYEADMTKFLREIVKFPGESCGENGF